MFADLKKFAGKLPYSSEIYGIYQPLIGWKSRLIQKRLTLDLPALRQALRSPLVDVTQRIPDIFIQPNPGGVIRINEDGVPEVLEGDINLFYQDPEKTQFQTPAYLDSMIVRWLQREARQQIEAEPPEHLDFWSQFWSGLLSADNLNAIFQKSVDEIINVPLFSRLEASELNTSIRRYVAETAALFADRLEAVEYIFNKEAYVARYLNDLLPKEGEDPLQVGFPAKVNALLIKTVPPLNLGKALELMNPLNLANGAGREAVLSPIGIIHLYRQYFFEFETFLGAPVEHLWLSPGSVTELIEVSTRKVIQEHTLEQFSEAILRQESSQTVEDELSRAIKDENERKTEYGSQLSGGVNILIAEFEASGSMSIQETQKQAREENHRTLRQQSAKLSSEIRSNFKSTFRTVTEVTDMRSKRYTITNSTNKLVNYELRRKMRQVGVQMQDVGTQLCWQVYVDDPGRELGVAQLVHLASKADLSAFTHQPLKKIPGDLSQVVTILLPVPNPGDRSKLGPILAAGAAGFVLGAVPGVVVGVSVYEVLDDLFGGEEKKDYYDVDAVKTIHQPYKIALPEGYTLAEAAQQEPDDQFAMGAVGQIPLRWLGKNGRNILSHMTIINAGEGVMDLVVNGGSVTPGEIIEFQAKIKIIPTPAKVAAVTEENNKIVQDNKNKDQEKERKIKEEFVKSVKERVEFASAIKPRPAVELREEERIVIYRNLIQKLMREAWSLAVDRKVAHLRSELIKAIFDVEKMLYYVAPEWWQPRLHPSSQGLSAEIEEEAGPSMNVISKAALAKASFAAAKTELRAKSRSLGTLETQDLVGWGGEGRPDNYLITENSAPARLGSSLGWLLQLDGDNHRNAFLNAPWVKAVIPIRAGKEGEALQWLKQSQVEGVEGLGEVYAGDDREAFKNKYLAKFGVEKDPTIEEVLDLLVDELVEKHQAALQVVEKQVEGAEGELGAVFYLRPEEVFETGFNPLQGGFRATPKEPFEVLDQWIEVLPTDQIVAVEVEYDPKTGFLK